jgi:putative colanic acid biosynthesis acetyltransferase WcaF
MTIETFNPVQTTPYTRWYKVKINLWKLINKTIFRVIPNQIKKPRILLLRWFGAKIATGVNINRHSNIEHPWNLEMGYLSSLGEGAWAYCLDKIIIGEKCCIGKDVYLITGSHEIDSTSFNLKTQPIIIENGCWIATGAYILPGVVLKQFSVVSAKTLVIKSTDSFDVVGGNPAKFIKKRSFIN